MDKNAVHIRQILNKLLVKYKGTKNIHTHEYIKLNAPKTPKIMIANTETAEQIAKLLLEIKAVKLQPDQPFVWASGWKSPIYCDNRITLSYPRMRTYIRQQLANLINEKFGEIDVIAAVATASIAQGALVAEDLGKPFIYVRTEAKAHGLQNQIEGVVTPGASVVVIEDLISTGKSSIAAAQALTAADMTVKGVVSIFSYEFEAATQAYKAASLPFYALSGYETLINYAQKEDYISTKHYEALIEWRKNPENWGK
jgi:orotate phosphoribosyltransferase